VIVVDDGSTDETARVAQEYCDRYPDIVRLERKENGGHGSAVNRGLEVATGTFFKVVDSDDWLDKAAFRQVLAALRAEPSLDLLVANYVYECVYSSKRHTVSYRNVFPQGRVFTWGDVQRFRFHQMLLMHSMIYRTQLLRDCGLRLPEHTFYVDNIVAFVPLPYVKTMRYLDCDLYRYFIGRPDQSVNTSVMIRRIDQQLRVTRIMTEAYNLFRDVRNINLRRYMLHYLSMMVTISLVHLNMSDNKDDKNKGYELWAFIRQYDEQTYNVLHRNFINVCVQAAGKGSPFVTKGGFHIVKRIYKFS
jgi:glycosyltransferase involved in cell wall biosynthesis